jgi:hypothetical protein
VWGVWDSWLTYLSGAIGLKSVPWSRVGGEWTKKAAWSSSSRLPPSIEAGARLLRSPPWTPGCVSTPGTRADCEEAEEVEDCSSDASDEGVVARV